MIDKWKKAGDNKVCGALPTDLSKAFDCICHYLLIPKIKCLVCLFRMVFSCFKNETGLSSISKTTSKLGNLTVFGRILHLESHRSQYKDTFSSIPYAIFSLKMKTNISLTMPMRLHRTSLGKHNRSIKKSV